MCEIVVYCITGCYLILYHPQSYLILFCIISSPLIPPHPIPSHLIPSHPILSYHILSLPFNYDLNEYHPFPSLRLLPFPSLPFSPSTCQNQISIFTACYAGHHSLMPGAALENVFAFTSFRCPQSANQSTNRWRDTNSNVKTRMRTNLTGVMKKSDKIKKMNL